MLYYTIWKAQMSDCWAIGLQGHDSRAIVALLFTFGILKPSDARASLILSGYLPGKIPYYVTLCSLSTKTLDKLNNIKTLDKVQ